MYKSAPELAEKEARDYFVRALPSNLKMAVAAQGPQTVNDCIDIINKLCVILDTNEDLNEIQKGWRSRRASCLIRPLMVRVGPMPVTILDGVGTVVARTTAGISAPSTSSSHPRTGGVEPIRLVYRVMSLNQTPRTRRM